MWAIALPSRGIHKSQQVVPLQKSLADLQKTLYSKSQLGSSDRFLTHFIEKKLMTGIIGRIGVMPLLNTHETHD